MTGDVLGGYRVVRLIGQGGQSEVYEARHVTTGQQVALKVLLFKHDLNPVMLQRARAEAKIEMKLAHPNLVKVFAAGIDQERKLFYTAMELLDGETLEDRIHRRVRLDVREALWIAVEATDGLAMLHHRNVVHRDVKPANVFLTRDGRVVLIDLGIAKFEDAEFSSIRTDSNIILGTFAYISPEQIERKGRPDGRTDLYSLGLVIWRMLAGKHPGWDHRARPHPPDTREWVTWHLGVKPPLVSTARPDVPLNVAGLIARAVEKEPALRPESAETFANQIRELIAWIDENPPLRPSAPPPGRLPPGQAPSSEVWRAFSRATTREDDDKHGPGKEARIPARMHESAQAQLLAPPPREPTLRTTAGTDIVEASAVLPAGPAPRAPAVSAPELPASTRRAPGGTEIIEASAVLPAVERTDPLHVQSGWSVPAGAVTEPDPPRAPQPASMALAAGTGVVPATEAAPMAPPMIDDARSAPEPDVELLATPAKAAPATAPRSASLQALPAEPPAKRSAFPRAARLPVGIAAVVLCGFGVLVVLRHWPLSPTASPDAGPVTMPVMLADAAHLDPEPQDAEAPAADAAAAGASVSYDSPTDTGAGNASAAPTGTARRPARPKAPSTATASASSLPVQPKGCGGLIFCKEEDDRSVEPFS